MASFQPWLSLMSMKYTAADGHEEVQWICAVQLVDTGVLTSLRFTVTPSLRHYPGHTAALHLTLLMVQGSLDNLGLCFHI